MALERHLEENCAQHLTLVGALANRQQQQLTTLKAALARLSLNYTGTLIWKISDWAAKMNDAKSKDGMELVSPPFYTSQYGYKLQVKNIFKIYLKPYFNSIIHFIFFLYRLLCSWTETELANPHTCRCTSKYYQENTMLCCAGLSLTPFLSRSSIRPRVQKKLATSSKASFPIPLGKTSKGPAENRIHSDSVSPDLFLTKWSRRDIS